MGIRNLKTKPLIIGITGNLGTGKTTITKILRKMKFRVISCDKIVNDLWKEKDFIEK
ncbi:MAG: dephospho-CoA kinase, partial [bacterium]|nr:dephospho-CoA kinase [bacterium]MDW8163571.1 dephospho-CoA kinase [Candidatus Omnitrophota bacterium]